MNFNEIEQEESKKEPQEQETPQMSIGQQLEIMSRVTASELKLKEIEYQNNLVMTSLEQYNQKYEQLKKEQSVLLDKLDQRISLLKKSNVQLSDAISREVEGMTDRSNAVIKEFAYVIDRQFSDKVSKATEEARKTIEELQELTSKANKRFENYYNRKELIDYLIFAYMGLTPILFGVVIWLLLK